MKSELSEKLHKHARLKRRIALFCAAIGTAICIVVAKAAVSAHNAASDRARIEAANFSKGFEQQIRGTLDDITGSMEFLKRRIEVEGKTFDLADWKKQIPELVSSAFNIEIIDDQGWLLATTAKRPSNPVSYADREYFQALRDNPSLRVFIGPPVEGKISKRLIITASRRLETKNGQFAGVLNFSVVPETFHQRIPYGKAVATLLRTDGITLARYIAGGLDVPSMGRKVTDIKALIDAKFSDAGEYSGKSPFDGVMRLVHWRKVTGYPLIVLAGLDEAEVFAAANDQASIVIGLGIVALSLALGMMLMLNREISRCVRHEIALDKINAEVVLAQRACEEASRAKSAFLAHMSHELRTPLNAVLGFSAMIRDELAGKDLDRYTGYADDIHQSGAHLLQIVNDVLDVSKIESGKFELREEEVKVQAVIQASLLAVQQQAANGSITVTAPAQGIGASFFGDKTKLKQILINLLSNAIKFTPPGGAVSIDAARDENGGMCLMIRDTGIGMSSEEIQDALELFGQIDSSHSRRFEGTGLGLPLSIRLTELHGGTLTIDSTPGKGTAVTVCFPANRITWD